MLSFFIVLGHLLLIVYYIYKGNGPLEYIPVISSVFLYSVCNIYQVARIWHKLVRRMKPINFNWTLSVKMEWDTTPLTKEILESYLKTLKKDFSISYPSTSNNFIIKTSGRNEEVKVTFNPNNTFFEISYSSWQAKKFKENLDKHIGKLFQYIEEKFRPMNTIYSVLGNCDKFFTHPEAWKLLSNKNSSNLKIIYQSSSKVDRASVIIKRNGNKKIKEEINIPTAFNIPKLSSLIEDYINLSLTKK
ncbi:MAG: hypothetical protein N4A38_04980 [Candidatus Gracilibacteria bacterium]|nr:hypothetical protein [Candidatus Gracilibacteria bacterium]